MSFLPIVSVGQALQAVALAHGAVSVARAGFDRLLEATLDKQPEPSSAATNSPATTLGLPASRQGASASHFGLTTRLQSFAQALRERLLPHLGTNGLTVTISADGDFRLSQSDPSATDMDNLFASDESLRAIVQQIAATLADFTHGGVRQVARFTLSSDRADVQIAPS